MLAVSISDTLPNYELFVEMQQQLNDIIKFAEFTFMQTQVLKNQKLQERVQTFVDSWRARFTISSLIPAESALFSLFIGAAFNQLPSFSEVAMTSLTQAVRLSREEYYGYIQLGICSMKAGAWRRALLMFEHGGQHTGASKKCQVACLMSQLYRQVPAEYAPDAMSKALQYAKEAVSLDAGDPVAYFNLGLCLLRIGYNLTETEAAKAGHVLRKAIQLREQKQQAYPDARFNFAVLCKIRLDFQQAYDQFLQTQAEDPGMQLAAQKAKDIENLMAAAQGRIGARMLQPAVFDDGSKTLQSLKLGKNHFNVELRIVSKIESGVPEFFIAQGTGAQDRNIRFLLSVVVIIKGLDIGAVLQIKDFYFKQLSLKTKTTQYQVFCIVISDVQQMVLNGSKLEPADVVSTQFVSHLD